MKDCLFDKLSLTLSTDLYEVAMAVSYLREGLTGKAVFEVSVRDLPASRAFGVFAGLDILLELLESFEITKETIEVLTELTHIPRASLEPLEGLHFEGDVWAMPEGTVFFAREPLVVIEERLPVAQLIETIVLNALHIDTLVASKAVRFLFAAPGKGFVDFGSRRAHGLDGAMRAARAAYLGGFSATSNLEAARRFNIPAVGTMAHSYVLAHPSEEDAFYEFGITHPENALFLVDTYDPIKGTRAAIAAAKRLAKKGIRFKGVRIDSGDLVELSRSIRQLLDSEGFSNASILASGGLDEYEVEHLVSEGAAIDAFGIGTRLVVSDDAPFFDFTYKCVQFEGKALMKLSPGKPSLPGRKQVLRRYEEGLLKGDVIELADENTPGLLTKVMEKGRRRSREDLDEARKRVATNLKALPEEFSSIHCTPKAPVSLGPRLQSLFDELSRKFR